VRLGLELAVAAAPGGGQAVAELALGVFQLLALHLAHAQVDGDLGRQVAVVQALQPLQRVAVEAQAGAPGAHRVMDLPQADAGRHAHVLVARGLGPVERARPLLGRVQVVALLVGQPAQRLGHAGGLQRPVRGVGGLRGLGQVGLQLQRAAAVFQQVEAQHQRVGRARGVALRAAGGLLGLQPLQRPARVARRHARQALQQARHGGGIGREMGGGGRGVQGKQGQSQQRKKEQRKAWRG
jgi:hypothetical protein